MFENLIESRGTNRRSVGHPVVSLAVHVALAYGAVRATAGVAEEVKKTIVPETIPFLVPLNPTARPQAAASEVPTLPPDAPPLQNNVVLPPETIPSGIPKVDVIDRGGAKNPSWVASVVRGPSRLQGDSSVERPTFVEADVDDPVREIEIPAPRYPAVMRQAGIAGIVTAQYIVDTLGRAEPTSWRVVSSTNTAFEGPAREAILAGRFKPARIRGQAVRQVVQQSIRFNIAK